VLNVQRMRRVVAVVIWPLVAAIASLGLAGCTHAPTPPPPPPSGVTHLRCQGTNRPTELNCRRAVLVALREMRDLGQEVTARAAYADNPPRWTITLDGVVFEWSGGPGVPGGPFCGRGTLVVYVDARSGKDAGAKWDGGQRTPCPTGTVQPYDLP
jgi:hypothetical protein